MLWKKKCFNVSLPVKSKKILDWISAVLLCVEWKMLLNNCSHVLYETRFVRLYTQIMQRLICKHLLPRTGIMNVGFKMLKNLELKLTCNSNHFFFNLQRDLLQFKKRKKKLPSRLCPIILLDKIGFNHHGRGEERRGRERKTQVPLRNFVFKFFKGPFWISGLILTLWGRH